MPFSCLLKWILGTSLWSLSAGGRICTGHGPGPFLLAASLATSLALHFWFPLLHSSRWFSVCQNCIIFLFHGVVLQQRTSAIRAPWACKGSVIFALPPVSDEPASPARRGRGRSLSLLQLLCSSLLPNRRCRQQWPAQVFMVTGFRRIQWHDPWYTAVHHLLPCPALPCSLSLPPLSPTNTTAHKEGTPPAHVNSEHAGAVASSARYKPGTLATVTDQPHSSESG
jgi:hypothetical protein